METKNSNIKIGINMKYKLYTFTGLTCCDGTTKSISLYDVIKNHSELLTPSTVPGSINLNINIASYTANTLRLYEDKLFCLKADCYDLESIQKYIEDGFVIVPFSRTFFIMDLLPYYEQGLDIVFMTIKEYKQFKKDYEDSLLTVEDHRTKELF